MKENQFSLHQLRAGVEEEEADAKEINKETNPKHGSINFTEKFETTIPGDAQ